MHSLSFEVVKGFYTKRRGWTIQTPRLTTIMPAVILAKAGNAGIYGAYNSCTVSLTYHDAYSTMASNGLTATDKLTRG